MAVLAYLVKHAGLTTREAVAHVRRHREIFPNEGFLRRLAAWASVPATLTVPEAGTGGNAADTTSPGSGGAEGGQTREGLINGVEAEIKRLHGLACFCCFKTVAAPFVRDHRARRVFGESQPDKCGTNDIT